MDRQEMATLLEKLRRELESNPAVDDGLRQSLQALEGDIRKVLAQGVDASMPVTAAVGSAVAGKSAGGDEGPLNERAQELEAKFSAEHPYLASTLRDVMDTLGKMGI